MGIPDQPFVPADFDVPRELLSEGFHLEPLGPEHNEADLAAWSSSIPHIRATPGFEASSWPDRVMTLDENRGDLERHARDFAERTGFTYTVMDEAGTVIGCVYIYPSRDATHDAHIRSWVRVTDADRDAVLYRAVRDWLAAIWPFANPEYAPRGG
jgi:hypothetical protein